MPRRLAPLLLSALLATPVASSNSTEEEPPPEEPEATDAEADEAPADSVPRWQIAAAIAAAGALALSQRDGSSDSEDDAITAPPIEADGDGTGLAVIDSDYRMDHRELTAHEARYQRHYDPAQVDTGTTTEQVQQHGTLVASIAAGAEIGVAPAAELFPHADGLDSGAWSGETFFQAVDAAEADNARILNLSAAYLDSSDQIVRRLRQFTANDRLLVVAAGNEGADGPQGDVGGAIDTFHDRALAVGALDKDERLAHFSNRAGDDEAIQARFLTAPGVGLQAASSGSGSGSDEGYTRCTGTSCSSPVVAGAAALIHSEWEHLSAEEIATLLLETADWDFDGYTPERYGQGRLDLEAALQPQGTLHIPVTEDETAEATATTAHRHHGDRRRVGRGQGPGRGDPHRRLRP